MRFGRAIDLIGKQPNRAPVILVVAENHERFIVWCYKQHMNPLDGSRVRYIQKPEDLRARDGDSTRLIVVGDVRPWMEWYPMFKYYQGKTRIAQESKCKDLKTIALINASRKTAERWFLI